MRESGIGIARHVTKPKIFDEALHVRVPAGTKARLDALRADIRQGDFVRLLLEEALERREKAAARKAKQAE